MSGRVLGTHLPLGEPCTITIHPDAGGYGATLHGVITNQSMSFGERITTDMSILLLPSEEEVTRVDKIEEGSVERNHKQRKIRLK